MATNKGVQPWQKEVYTALRRIVNGPSSDADEFADSIPNVQLQELYDILEVFLKNDRDFESPQELVLVQDNLNFAEKLMMDMNHPQIALKCQHLRNAENGTLTREDLDQVSRALCALFDVRILNDFQLAKAIDNHFKKTEDDEFNLRKRSSALQFQKNLERQRSLKLDDFEKCHFESLCWIANSECSEDFIKALATWELRNIFELFVICVDECISEYNEEMWREADYAIRRAEKSLTKMKEESLANKCRDIRTKQRKSLSRHLANQLGLELSKLFPASMIYDFYFVQQRLRKPHMTRGLEMLIRTFVACEDEL